VKTLALSPTRSTGPSPIGACGNALLASIATIGTSFGIVSARAAAIAPTKPTSSARVKRQYTSASRRPRASRASRASIAAQPARSSQPRAYTQPWRSSGSGRSHIPGLSGGTVRSTAIKTSSGRAVRPVARGSLTTRVISSTLPFTHSCPVQMRTGELGKYSGSTQPRKAARSFRPGSISSAAKPG
jgi:hypothetical protein